MKRYEWEIECTPSAKIERLKAQNAKLLDALKLAVRELEWLDANTSIKANLTGNYIEVDGLPTLRAVIKEAEEGE